MTEADKHMHTLTKLAEDCERTATFYAEGKYANTETHRIYAERAAALRWILDLNAYGVTPSEVTG